MSNNLESALQKRQHISSENLTIYDTIDVGDRGYWYTSLELEALLNSTLSGRSVDGLANKTRSKVLKQWICESLGYEVPDSFKKVRPRFTGQNFDTYSLKANNLQIYNEDVSPSRRYVIINITNDYIINNFRVINGSDLARLDNTGTKTKKYQARLIIPNTDNIMQEPVVSNEYSQNEILALPTDDPNESSILTFEQIKERLHPILGQTFIDPGVDQERSRGDEVHRLACRALGYSEFADNGRFPDIRHQLLEIKYQTSTTIDLGLIRPDSPEALDMPQLYGSPIKHSDVRYAIFIGKTNGEIATIENVVVTTGADFFSHAKLFEGIKINEKIQIKLSTDFLFGNSK